MEIFIFVEGRKISTHNSSKTWNLLSFFERSGLYFSNIKGLYEIPFTEARQYTATSIFYTRSIHGIIAIYLKMTSQWGI